MYTVISKTYRRTFKHILSVLTIIVAILFVQLAYAAPSSPLTWMQILSEGSKNGTTITITAGIDSSTTLPVVTEIVLPQEVTITSVNQIDTAKRANTGLAKYSLKKSSDENIYSVSLDRGDAFELVCTTSKKVISETGETHAVASLALLAPSDLTNLMYGFVLSKGLTSKDALNLGTTSDGRKIFGKEFTDVKKGAREVGAVAVMKEKTNSAVVPVEKKPSTLEQILYNPVFIAIGALVVGLILLMIIVMLLNRAKGSDAEGDIEDDTDDLSTDANSADNAS